mmetsp:Transcript_12066/g.16372  ORF Transcript_12066/g.16372 Transcript_12066/m.16372 type:complete len:167 (+) Transcript_12066:96-596(+)
MVIPSFYGEQVASIGFQALFWVLNMVISVIGLFSSLYLYVSHDDLRHAMIEPGELSESLNQYLPVEMALSMALACVSTLIAPWWVMLLALPLAVYNVVSFKRKDHRLHFLTKREYKKDFKRLEKAFLVKSVLYGLLLAVSLVFTVMTLCDWISSISRSGSRKTHRS